MDLVEDVRGHLFPGDRILLAMRIIDDALTPLQDTRHPKALMRAREHAGALLGLPIKA